MERVEAGLEEAELVAFGVSQDVPGLVAGLTDVGRARTELQEAFELGVLIAVGGVDVDALRKGSRLVTPYLENALPRLLRHLLPGDRSPPLARPPSGRLLP